MTDNTNDPELSPDEKQLLAALLSDDEQVAGFSESRRLFLKQIIAAGGALVALQLLGGESVFARINEPPLADFPATIENGVSVTFTVNGAKKSLEIDSRMTLLDVLRERLQLTGTKKGCDHGQCGACTVIVNEKRVLSCLTLGAVCGGKSVQTIEGFAKNGMLHPMQAAFLKHDGLQCGFCTPGQICSSIALIKEVKNGDASYLTQAASLIKKNMPLSDDEIRERMSGNICRCGAYANIVTAVKEVLSGSEVAQQWPMIPATGSNKIADHEQPSLNTKA